MVGLHEALADEYHLQASRVAELSRVEVLPGAAAWEVAASGCSLEVAKLRGTRLVAIG